MFLDDGPAQTLRGLRWTSELVCKDNESYTVKWMKYICNIPILYGSTVHASNKNIDCVLTSMPWNVWLELYSGREAERELALLDNGPFPFQHLQHTVTWLAKQFCFPDWGPPHMVV